ncbi:heavy metal translocating P-type ATPase [Mycoplasmopsis agassizii]|uniref:Cation-transporting P-type ATPase n=1 Tax=Mycoplasmopsis agassizii TaxID=33922 RepID=A0ABX4H5R9_9BACT|nr:cation-translocating P-type ATPase [Mycoplasmopsis agassizii]PAF55152.1 cation-transporting P-type ATPase [Mycoplasmopsis agassizii]SMC16793.1 Cu+-exporting ATPase [Mycoplasmopsis agassizii]
MQKAISKKIVFKKKIKKIIRAYYKVINKKYEFIFAWVIALSLLALFILMIIAKVQYNDTNDMTLMMKVEHPALLVYMAITSFWIQFWLGRSYYVNSYNEIFKWKNLGMNTLIASSTLIAWFYSFILMILKFVYAEHNIQIMTMEVAFEAGAVIIMILLSGDLISNVIRKKSISDLTALESLRATQAYKIINNQLTLVDLDEIKVGETIVVPKGAQVPLDGIIIKGESLFEQAVLTGESLPVLKAVNDVVIAGSINLNNLIEIKVTKSADDSYLNKIIEKVETIQSEKLPIQKMADKIAKWFTPLVFVIAIAAFLIIYFLGDDLYNLYNNQGLNVNYLLVWNPNNINAESMRISMSIMMLISVLVLACPCALGLAIPLALAVGASKAARHGISINNIESFEKMRLIKAIAFDKTGTLTTGKHLVKEVINEGKDELFLLSLEVNSLHPLAKSVVNYLSQKEQNKNQNLINFDEIKEVANQGLFATYQNNNYDAISWKTAINLNYHFDQKMLEKYEQIKANNSGSEIVFAINKKVISIYFFEDELRKDVEVALVSLKKKNIKIFLITGDNQKNADLLNKRLNFDGVFANVTPNNKAEIIFKLQSEYQNVAFTGDGINDLLALETANFKIAMNEGSDAAKSIADVILVNPNIENVALSIKIISQIRLFVKINFSWAFFYNLVFLPLAIFGFVNPIVGSLLMALSSISVLLNSLIYKLKKVSKK